MPQEVKGWLGFTNMHLQPETLPQTKVNLPTGSIQIKKLTIPYFQGLEIEV